MAFVKGSRPSNIYIVTYGSHLRLFYLTCSENCLHSSLLKRLCYVPEFSANLLISTAMKLICFISLSLQDRQLVRNLCRAGQRPNYPETVETLVPVFRKLHSQGITEEDEDKLLFLRDVILKLYRAKTRYNVLKLHS